MEKRVLIAVFLSFLVLYAYQAMFLPKHPTPAARSAASGASAPATVGSVTPASPAPVEAAPPEASTAKPSSPSTPRPATRVAEGVEREIVVESQRLRAVFTNRGGRLLHWVLKDYKDESGRPLDLIPQGVAWFPKPFSLRVADADLTSRMNTALFKADVAGDRLDATRDPATLSFDFEDASGLAIHKAFTVTPTSYVLTFSATATSNAQDLKPAITWGPGLGDVTAAATGGGMFSGSYVRPAEALFYQDGKFQRVPQPKVTAGETHQGDFRFAGVADHYFVACTILAGPQKIIYDPVMVPAPNEGEGKMLRLVASTFDFAKGTRQVRYYIGPKDFDVLKAIDPEFVRVIDLGVFAWLAVPLLGALQWIYGYIGNYGWSIIALTILINVVMFPLRHKSVVSMRKMQEVQPLVKAVQDRYANLSMTDPAKAKMNQEIMELYKSKGVNPASGCLPMLLTLPVLFAFYALLSQAIELRGAGFGLWITDLSAHDPLYITPVLMGLTMFWQQWITPTSADPVQQRMMMIMPIMFSFMFLWAPSGLVLYWFVSNLWAIGQQYFTNWLIGPPQVHVARPAAERRVKSVGTGKSTGAH